MSKKEIPRGIRNNNPLNIRIGNTWLGEVQFPTDNDFEQFVTMEYGLRAAFVILRRYIRRYGKNTIRKIISTWSPASENNTEAYIRTVSKLMSLSDDTPITYEARCTMMSLVAAMAYVECGCEIEMEKIAKAYDMT